MRCAHRLRVLLAVAGAALLLTACDGDEGPGIDDGPVGRPTAEEPGDGDGAAEATGSREFAELLGQGFSTATRVVYETTSQQGATQTIVLSSDGQQTAWLLPGARLITRAEGARILCLHRDEQVRCFEAGGRGLPGPVGSTAPFLGVATALQGGLEALPGYEPADEREIAGRPAACARFNPAGLLAAPAAGEATLCVDADTGVMLNYEASNPEAATASFEAAELGEPRDADFDPPAEPVPMERIEDFEQSEGMGQAS